MRVSMMVMARHARRMRGYYAEGQGETEVRLRLKTRV